MALLGFSPDVIVLVWYGYILGSESWSIDRVVSCNESIPGQGPDKESKQKSELSSNYICPLWKVIYFQSEVFSKTSDQVSVSGELSITTDQESGAIETYQDIGKTNDFLRSFVQQGWFRIHGIYAQGIRTGANPAGHMFIVVVVVIGVGRESILWTERIGRVV